IGLCIHSPEDRRPRQAASRDQSGYDVRSGPCGKESGALQTGVFPLSNGGPPPVCPFHGLPDLFLKPVTGGRRMLLRHFSPFASGTTGYTASFIRRRKSLAALKSSSSLPLHPSISRRAFSRSGYRNE